MMTRKDYKAIAAEIHKGIFTARGINSKQAENVLAAVMHSLSEYMKKDNSNFDKARFVDACYDGIDGDMSTDQPGA